MKAGGLMHSSAPNIKIKVHQTSTQMQIHNSTNTKYKCINSQIQIQKWKYIVTNTQKCVNKYKCTNTISQIQIENCKVNY